MPLELSFFDRAAPLWREHLRNIADDISPADVAKLMAMYYMGLPWAQDRSEQLCEAARRLQERDSGVD